MYTLRWLSLHYIRIVITLIDPQSNRSGKTSRALSGATSTEDPTATGTDCPTVSGNLPISMANLASSGSHEGSLKGKGVKATTRWSGLFGSTYKVEKESLTVISRYPCCIFIAMSS